MKDNQHFHVYGEPPGMARQPDILPEDEPLTQYDKNIIGEGSVRLELPFIVERGVLEKMGRQLIALGESFVAISQRPGLTPREKLGVAKM